MRSNLVLGILSVIAVILMCSFAITVKADDPGNFDWHVPGDGITATPFQIDDLLQGRDAQEASHIGTATSKGDVVYSYKLDLPPAQLKPSINLNYSSATRWSLEMVIGWSLSGIPEIRRPPTRGYTFDANDKLNSEFLISASGYSGTLKPSGSNDGWFFLRTAEPNYVAARYDESANAWTIHAGGLTTTLAAGDDGASSPDGTARWRATKQTDTVGNTIDFSYDANHRIGSISYGGNDTTGDAHLVMVDFEYEANTSAHTDVSMGFVVTFDRHLTKITVSEASSSSSSGASSKSSVSSTLLKSSSSSTNSSVASFATSGRFSAVDLVFATKDSEDRLKKLQREGKTDDDTETIASFEYTEFDDSDIPQRKSDKAPASLGGSYQYNTSTGGVSDETTHSLLDFNRDGLMDVINASDEDVDTTKVWGVTSQSVDHDARTFDWNAEKSVSTIGATMGTAKTDELDTTMSYGLTKTERELVDVDGDGYTDIVEGGSPTWTVHYGKGKSGFKDYTETPPAGWTHSSESWRLNADHEDAATVTKDLLKGFFDGNGDGWQDLYEPSTGTMWLHAGTRGGGWPTQVTLSQPDGSYSSSSRFDPFEALRSVRYTLDEITLPSLDLSMLCDQYKDYDTMGSTLGSEGLGEYAGGTINADGSTTDYYYSGDSEAEQAADAFYDMCVEMYNEITLRKMKITYINEIGGYYDVNGDGLKDYVDSDHAEHWQVYLNNGHDFEDAVSWGAPFAYSQRSDATSVFQTMIDVNGDGLPDLARLKDLEAITHAREWYQNLGDGFAANPQDLPDWWGTFRVTGGSNLAFEESTTLREMMIDIDNDGSQDHVTVEVTNFHDGTGYVEKSGDDHIDYGPFPGPHLLEKIDNKQGGTTEFTYRSLATVSPSGDWDEKQYTSVAKTLTDEIESTDSLTAQNAKTSFWYSDGFYDDGMFQGFEKRKITRETNGAWTSTTDFTYELDRDFDPLATKQEFYADGNLSFGSAISRGTASETLRYKVESDYGLSARREALARHTGYFHLIASRKITEYGEKTGSKSSTHSYEWDGYGNLTTYSHDGGGDTNNAKTVTMEWVSDAAGDYQGVMLQKVSEPITMEWVSDVAGDYPLFYKMSHKTVSGIDPFVGGGVRSLAEDIYYYDNHAASDDALTKGLLTKIESASGWLGGGESFDQSKLTVNMTYGDRGEMESAEDQETGSKIIQTFDFGSALVKTQTNNLGHTITNDYDIQGRLESKSDANGIKIAFTYDAFNRVKTKTAIGTDGAPHTLQTLTYARSAKPYYTVEETEDELADDHTKSYAFEDGFGRTVETRAQDETGSYLATTSLYDLRGLLFETSHPADKGKTFTAPSSFSVSSRMGKSYFDASGEEREKIADSAINTGSQLVYHDSPRQTVSQDEEGYQTKLSFDAFHRVTKVRQGKSDSYTTTATYSYNALDQLVIFEDGNGVCYGYSYDATGRLRQVKHGKKKTSKTLGSSSCTPATTWYTYEYDGILKTKMTDAKGLYTTWDYDELGRPETMVASDTLPGSTSGTLTYTWDYDDALKGAVYKTTDPSGETVYAYDALGRVKSTDRTYTATTVSTTTASFDFENDVHGRIMSKTLPSGRVIKQDLDYGFVVKTSSYADAAKAAADTSDYTITYDYNDWGLMSKATSSLGHTYTNTFTTPLWGDKSKFAFGTTAYNREYGWHDNGLLKTRTTFTDTTKASTSGSVSKTLAGAVKSAVGSSKTSSSSSSSSSSKISLVSSVTSIDTTMVYSYDYDSLKELAKIATPTKTYESYSYDAAGNLKTMLDHDGVTWTYGTPGTLNQISERTTSSGKSETYSYDNAGRMEKNGSTTHYYDGLGRLRGVYKGTWQMILDYDADGQLVRRADNNPFEGTASYEYSYGDWRYSEVGYNGNATAITTEFEMPFVSSVGGTRSWLFKEYDGGTVMTFNDSGTRTMHRLQGGYGAEWNSTGTAWSWNSFHGTEEQGDLFHMGRRHLMQKDGTWLQPEPLLYLGIPSGALTKPLSLATYRYAMNSPTAFADIVGMDPVVMDVQGNEDTSVIDVTYDESAAGPVGAEGPMADAVNTYEDFLSSNPRGEDPEADANSWVVEDLLDSLEPTNPNTCASGAIATDATLRNRSAKSGYTKDTNTRAVEKYMGTDFKSMGSNIDFLVTEMQDAGSGATGIVFAARGSGIGHYFNVINIGGIITFIDTQTDRSRTGWQADTSGYSSFDLMVTSYGDEL